MTPQVKQVLSNFLMASMAAGGATGFVEELLLREARINVSAQITAPELAAMLLEFADKGWIIKFTPAMGAARWRITALGESVAAEARL
jgi:hypothetical protein